MVRENDLDLLQGSWRVIALAMDGQKMPPDMLANARIVIEGDRFSNTGMGAVYAGTIQLDTSAKPRRLDMKFDTGPEKGHTNLAIYELKGNTWRLCLSTRGAGRPSSFASPPGSGIALETLSRGKAPESAKGKERGSKKLPALTQNDGPATVFEGDWRLVSASMDGKLMEESAVQWVKRVTRGNRTIVYAGPQVMLQVEFTSDSSRTPKTIDYLNIAGSNKGKTQFGIYEFEGDLLKFHVAAPGAARPTHFDGAAGERGTVTVWKRV